MPSSMLSIDTSKVPPPRLKMSTLHSPWPFFLSVRNGRSCRLVDYPQNIESCNHAGVLRRLTLAVVEVGGHCDHCFIHWRSQVCLSCLLHLHEDHRAYLLRSERLFLALVLHSQFWKAVLLHHLERPMLPVRLHC